MKRITLDTNILPPEEILETSEGFGFEFAVVSVTNRELSGTDIEMIIENLVTVTETAVWGESIWGQSMWGPVVAEPFVLGESRLGEGMLGDKKDVFEMALKIISNGAFPKKIERENLTDPQRRQLRDAMILTAHIRDQRDILVTNDRKGFIDNGRREIIEKTFKTQVLTQIELLEDCQKLKQQADKTGDAVGL